MPNFTAFPPGYLASRRVPTLFTNVNLIVQQANNFEYGPKCYVFAFDLRNVPNVMENIMAFDAATDPKSMLCPEVLDMMTKMHIKTEISRYLRRHDGDDPKRDSFTVDGRLRCLQIVLDDLRLMQEEVNEALKGNLGHKPCLDHEHYLRAYLNRMDLLRNEILRVQEMFLRWDRDRDNGSLPERPEQYTWKQKEDFCNIW